MAQNLKKLILLTILLFLLVNYLSQKGNNLAKNLETVSIGGSYVEAFNCGQQKLSKQWAKFLCNVPLRFQTLKNSSVLLSSSQNLKNKVEIHFSMIDTISLNHVCSRNSPIKTVDNVTVYNILQGKSWLGSSNACVLFSTKKCCPDGVWIPPEQLHVRVVPGACLQNGLSTLNHNSSSIMICDPPLSATGWSSSYATSEKEKADYSRIKYAFVAYCAVTLYFISSSLRRYLMQTYFTGN